MRAAPSNVGWILSLLIRPGLTQKVCQFTALPGHHLDSQRLSDEMWLNVSSQLMGRDPEKTMGSIIVFCICPHRLSMNFCDFRPAQLDVISADMNYSFTEFMFIVCRITSLSGVNRLETWSGGWRTVVGFEFGLRFFRTVIQLPWFPGCSGVAGGQLAGATLGLSAPATGSWLAIAAKEFCFHGAEPSFQFPKPCLKCIKKK